MRSEEPAKRREAAETDLEAGVRRGIAAAQQSMGLPQTQGRHIAVRRLTKVAIAIAKLGQGEQKEYAAAPITEPIAVPVRGTDRVTDRIRGKTSG